MAYSGVWDTDENHLKNFLPFLITAKEKEAGDYGTGPHRMLSNKL